MFSFLAELLLLFVRGLYMNTVKEKKNRNQYSIIALLGYHVTEEKENKKKMGREI